MELGIKLLHGAVHMPEYASEGAAGFDLRAYITKSSSGVEQQIDLSAGATIVINTGLAFEIPAGYEVQIRSRSGLAAKHSVHVLNAPGTVDEDFKGEVKVILHNSGSDTFRIENGDRIAQAVLSPVTRAALTPIGSLSQTKRGGAGFGSTGNK